MYTDNSLGRTNRLIQSQKRSLEKAMQLEQQKKQRRKWLEIKHKIARKFKQKYKVTCTIHEIEGSEISDLQKLLVKRRIRKRNHTMATRIQKLFRGHLGRLRFKRIKSK